MVNGNISCEQVWHEVSNYIDGEVDANLRRAMDEHFHSCARCASVLAGMKNVVSLYGDERMMEAPAGFSRRLQQKLAASAHPARKWSTWSAWLVPVAALALLTGGLRFANSLTTSAPLKSAHAQQAHDIPSNLIVVVTHGARLFHSPGCEAIHNKETEKSMTAQEAMRQGYVPCPRCLRKYMEAAKAGHAAPDAQAEADLDDDADVPRGQ